MWVLFANNYVTCNAQSGHDMRNQISFDLFVYKKSLYQLKDPTSFIT